MKGKGKFIVFEGLDGSGQSTQSKLLKDYLEGKERRVVLTKEPTKDSRAGREIFEIVANKKKSFSKRLQELFSEDRRSHVENVIEPALQKGLTVISDRYFFSTFAYGDAEGVDLKYLYDLNKEFPLPDIVFFLNVSPEIALVRIKKRNKERAIFETEGKLKKIHSRYKRIFKDFQSKTKIYYINGEGSITKVSNKIKQIINEEKL